LPATFAVANLNASDRSRRWTLLPATDLDSGHCSRDRFKLRTFVPFRPAIPKFARKFGKNVYDPQISLWAPKNGQRIRFSLAKSISFTR